MVGATMVQAAVCAAVCCIALAQNKMPYSPYLQSHDGTIAPPGWLVALVVTSGACTWSSPSRGVLQWRGCSMQRASLPDADPESFGWKLGECTATCTGIGHRIEGRLSAGRRARKL